MFTSLDDSVVFSKKSSKDPWNCGDTSPVFELSTRYMLHACEGEGPRLTPSLALGDHLGMTLPPCSVFCRANTEQPTLWLSDTLASTSRFTNTLMNDLPSGCNGTMLCRCTAFLSAYGHRVICTQSSIDVRHVAIVFQLAPGYL